MRGADTVAGSDIHQQLSQLLAQLAAELQHQQLWQLESPSAQALASTEPFCVDTLSFSQWLQWMMIPRFEQMIAAGMSLPSRCEIQPMAEEGLKDLGAAGGKLVALIGEIDRTLTVVHH